MAKPGFDVGAHGLAHALEPVGIEAQLIDGKFGAGGDGFGLTGHGFLPFISA